MDSIPAGPDPLASVTGRLRPLRWAIRATAIGFVAAVCLLLLACVGLLASFLLQNGIPFFMGGGPVVGDDRDRLVEMGQAMPPVILPAALAAVASAGLLRLLVFVASRFVRNPTEAMLNDFHKRIQTEVNGSPVGEPTLADRLQVAVVLATGVSVYIATWVWVANVWNLSLVPDGVEWIEMVVVVSLIMLFELLIAWGLWEFSGGTIAYFVRPMGIRSSDVDALREAGDQEREALALRRSPDDGTALRLGAAVAVFASRLPPKPEGSDRALWVPWTGATTGLEILAGSLLAAAVLECRERGLLECQFDGDKTRLTAHLPDTVRPEGLARIVLGHRAFGLDRGRLVRGSLGDVMNSWMWSGDEDPHWVVIEIALDDLREAGVMVEGRLDVAALHVAAASTSSSQFAVASMLGAEPMTSLSAAWSKALGKQRVVGEVGQGLFVFAGLAKNTWDRGGHRLPEPLSVSGG